MTSSLLIKNLKFDKFGDFSSDIDFKTKMDIFRDDISLIINQYHLRRTQSVRQPRSASKRSALVYIYIRATLQTLRVCRVALRAPGVTQSNLFWDFFLLYKYCKQRLTKHFSYGFENIIFEIYSTKTPCQPLEASL